MVRKVLEWKQACYNPAWYLHFGYGESEMKQIAFGLIPIYVSFGFQL